MEVVVEGVAGDAALLDYLAHRYFAKRFLLRKSNGAVDDGLLGGNRHGASLNA